MHAQHDNIDFREGKLLVQDITSLTQQLHIPLLQLATFILENSVVYYRVTYAFCVHE